MAHKSIMPTERGTCYLCGCNKGYDKHHCIHGYANRKIADREGLWVYLCRDCHTGGKHAVHNCIDTDIHLEREAQSLWEERYIKDYPYKNHAEEAAREAFRELFGKSYL